MTDKKSIMIDNINLDDVKNLLYTGQRTAITTATFEKIIERLEEKTAECEDLKQKYELEKKQRNSTSNLLSKAIKERDVYLERLDNKTAECEELEKRNNNNFVEAIFQRKQAKRYKQALDEIESYFIKYDNDKLDSYETLDYIRDIISKAKGEK